MSEPNQRAQPQRAKQGRSRRRRPKPVDLWRPVPELEAPEPIAHAGDPATMLRSLGDPPLQAHSITAGHYLAAVVEKAAGLAVALAATADLLDDDDLDDDHLDDDDDDDVDHPDDVEVGGNQG
jgi:hypothetical protein